MSKEPVHAADSRPTFALANFFHSFRRAYLEQLEEPSDTLRTIIRNLWLILVSLCVMQCLSGVLISFSYSADTQPERDSQGRILVRAVYNAQQGALLDADGDIVAEPAKVYLLPFSGTVQYPLNRADLFTLLDDPAHPISAAQLGMQYHLSSSLAGNTLQLSHSFGASAAMAIAGVLVALFLVKAGYRLSVQPSWLASCVMVMLLAFSAWLGSLLVWDARAQQSLSLIGSFVRDYVPFGTVLSGIISQNHSNLLMRVFVLHALLVPLAGAYLWRRQVTLGPLEVPPRSNQNGEKSLASILALWGTPLLVLCAAISKASMQSIAQIAPTATTQIKPEWYFSAPYALLKFLPTDLCALILWTWLVLLLSLPLLQMRMRKKWVVKGIGYVLAISLVSATLIGILL